MIPAVLAFVYFLQKIDFVRADLGRMLRGGVLTKNAFSYTEPAYPVLNSHWGSDLIFKAVHRLGGFEALTVFHALLGAAAVFLFYRLAKERSDRLTALFFTLLCLPLAASRTYVRPEVFSYIFLGLFLHCLRSGRLGALPLMQILWANLHFFFFLGPLTIAAHLMFADRTRRPFGTGSGRILLLSILACAVSPYGFANLLLPFSLLKHYGFTPAECLPLWTLMRSAPHPSYVFFLITAALCVLAAAASRAWKVQTPLFVLTTLFTVAGFAAVRAIPLLALAAMPFLAGALGPTLREFPKKTLRLLCGAAALLPFLNPALTPLNASFGAGLAPDSQAAARFMIEEKVRGNLFNNYGSGSYLIYYLFPEKKVFVDNRPEAYSEQFLRTEYLQALGDEGVWRAVKRKYSIESIFFHLGMSPYPRDARPFLVRRMTDPEWAVVHLDAHAAVLVRRQGPNADLARRKAIDLARIYVR